MRWDEIVKQGYEKFLKHHEDLEYVVRCKDCKYCEWYIKSHYKNGIEHESYECRQYKIAVTPDWYCADGERKETEDGRLD